MCGNGGDAEQTEHHTSSARVVQKGGGGWDGGENRVFGFEAFSFDLVACV